MTAVGPRVLVTAASRHGSTHEITAVRAPVGDFRDWAAVSAWADALAAELAAPASRSSVVSTDRS